LFAHSKQIEEDTGRSMTYGGLLEIAELVARHLRETGCRQHDVIAIFAPNSIEWIEFFLAALRIGAVPALVNPLLRLGKNMWL
jgi:acyl-CoA synthetase (AMP-forming)/AMP-acid ligase II